MIRLLKRIVDVLTILLQVLGSNLPIVLSLLAIYLVMGVADQGQDMLININMTNWGPLTLYFMLGVLAMLHWQAPKFFTPYGIELPKFKNIFSAKFASPVNADDPYRIVPRLFGVLTWLIAAYCILKVMLKYNVHQPGVNDWYRYLPNPDWFLLISTVLFGILLWKDYFLVFYDWLHKKRGGKYYFSAICIVLAASPVIFWPFNYSLPCNQVFLFAGFTLYALLFALLTSTRWSIMQNSTMPVVCFLFNDKTITVAVWCLTFICSGVFLFFVLCNVISINIPYSYRITLGIVLCGFVFYLTLIILLIYRSKRSRKNYFAFAVVLVIILATVNPAFFHEVKLYKRPANAQAPAPLRAYIAGWIRARADSLNIDSNKCYPVIFVNSYGGGIRAAAWTCLVANALDSRSNGSFQQHVFCYSGASGGTVGAAVVCANGFNPYFNSLSYPQRDSLYHLFFTRYDYLTGDLVGLLGNDALSSILPRNRFSDRAAFQAESMENAYEDLFKDTIFGSDLFDLWNRNAKNYHYSVPLLFSNSAEVTRGYKGILAPVQLNNNDFLGDELINKMLGADSNGIKLSTAAFLSARFPYFSPAGQIKHKYFIDGGAKENSGAETNFAVSKVFEQVIKDSFPALAGRFPFVCISLKNTNHYDSIVESTKKMSQLFAPLNGVINGGINGATDKSDSINRFAFAPHYFLFYPQAEAITWQGKNIFGCTDSELTHPVMPLGWQFSDLAMGYMEKSVKENNYFKQKENNILYFISCLNGLCKKQ